MRIVALTTIILAVLCGPARCDSPKPEPLPRTLSVHAYGGAHPDCQEWSDGCVTCARDGKCSTPGIACLPQEIVCRKSAK